MSNSAGLAPKNTGFVHDFRRALASQHFIIAFIYFFCLLFAYYLLRPVREEMGIQAGVENLPYLYSGTVTIMILIIPVFGYLKNKLSRQVLVMGVYLFFFANLMVFYKYFGVDPLSPWTARAFFVWLSVFNMFAVSVFWSLMADVLEPGEVKILFGPISAGGSLGGIVGSLVTASLIEHIPVRNLMLLAALLLVVVAICAGLLLRKSEDDEEDVPLHFKRRSREASGGAFAGLTEIFRSDYLAKITMLAFIYTLTATLLYQIQANLVNEFISDSAVRTRFFANVNLAINIIALTIQFFLTSMMVRRLGVGTSYGLTLMIIFTSIVTLGIWPAVATLAAAQIFMRGGQFGVMKPCFDMLFSTLTEEQKYKSKNFIDTTVVRSADWVGALLFAGLRAVGLSISAVTGLVAAVMIGLAVLAISVGREFDRNQ